MSPSNALTPENFKYFIDFLQQKSGISLQEGQLYLIQNRLTPFLIEKKLSSLDCLVAEIKKNNIRFNQSVVECLTTHESSFFRDKRPFEYFSETILPILAETKGLKKQPVNIWSAACSSGQEPYSLAMLTKEFLHARPGALEARIIASDISKSILEKAKEGRYSHFEVQRGLSSNQLIKYFKKDGVDWVISDGLKNMIQFYENNLVTPTLLVSQKFDVIFCRNVLIYFNESIKNKVVNYLYENLMPNGILIIGGSEILSDPTKKFELIKEVPGVFRKV